MEKTVNLTLSESEASVLRTQMMLKIEQVAGRQERLLETMFENKRKVILASFGHKWGTIRGWHKVDPYTHDSDIVEAGKESKRCYSQLINDSIDLKAFKSILLKLGGIPYDDGALDEEQLKRQNLEKWNQIASILKNFGHHVTAEDCMQRLEKVFDVWESKSY